MYIYIHIHTYAYIYICENSATKICSKGWVAQKHSFDRWFDGGAKMFQELGPKDANLGLRTGRSPYSIWGFNHDNNNNNNNLKKCVYIYIYIYIHSILYMNICIYIYIYIYIRPGTGGQIPANPKFEASDRRR